MDETPKENTQDINELKVYRLWFNYGWYQGYYVGQSQKWAMGRNEQEAKEDLKQRLIWEHPEWEIDLKARYHVREYTFIRIATPEDIEFHAKIMKEAKEAYEADHFRRT